jgi:phosphohistidine phosphatase
MANRVLNRRVKIDAFVSSPAARAKQTAEYFAAAYDVKKSDIIFVSALYHAPPDIFYDVISTLPDTYSSAAVFAHNPGITHFVNELTDVVQVDNMPTCAVFAVQADIDSWKGFGKAKKEFIFFDFPKNI